VRGGVSLDHATKWLDAAPDSDKLHFEEKKKPKRKLPPYHEKPKNPGVGDGHSQSNGELSQ
jgi:hypothetical protein